MQNEKHLEINFIDYKFNKLKEELILELRRNISEKKNNYEKKSKDNFDVLKKNILYNNTSNNQEPRMNSGLKSIKEENVYEDFNNFKNLKSDCPNEFNNNSNNYKNDYPGDDVYFPNKNLNYDLYQQEEEDLYYNRDERKLSGNNIYRHRATGSKNSKNFSKKSVSPTGKLTDDENLFVL